MPYPHVMSQEFPCHSSVIFIVLRPVREIKFRAWHEPTQKIYPVKSLNFIFENGVTASLKGYSNDTDKAFTTLKWDRLMQYTGLKDKNGKEIYEGDIVGSPYGVNWEVRYVAPNWQLYRDENGGRTGTGDLSLWRNVEVRGNIHETPELLK